MAEFLKKRGVGYLLNAVAMLLGIIALICYLCTGEDKSKMTETFVSAAVYLPLIVGVVFNTAGLAYRNSLLKIGAFSAYFLGFALWIFNQAGYIVNVMMGIDGNTFGFGYVLAVVCMIAAMAVSLVATGKFRKKKDAEEGAKA